MIKIKNSNELIFIKNKIKINKKIAMNSFL